MWSSFFENVLQSVTEGTVTQDQARIKLTETITKAVRFTVCKRGGGVPRGEQAMGTPAAPHASGSLAPNAPRPEHDREAALDAALPRARAAPALAGRPSSCCKTAAWTAGALGPAPAALVPATPAPRLPPSLEPPRGPRPLRPPPGLAS